MSEKKSVEPVEVFYVYRFDQNIHKVLKDKSFFDSAVAAFIHWVTVVEKKIVVTQPKYTLTADGLYFAAHVLPKVNLETAHYVENLEV